MLMEESDRAYVVGENEHGGDQNLWANLMYLLPVATLLSQYELPEEFKMEGDLLTELDRLLRFVGCSEKFKIEKSRLKCRVDATYPKGTSVWTIFDGIMCRYHLNVFITSQKDDRVTISLKEGAAWSKL